MRLVIDQDMFNMFLSDNRQLNCFDSIYFSIPIEEIPPYFFSCLGNIVAIHLPKSVKKISKCAFSSCSHLETITGLDAVQQIENEAFAHCPNLKTLAFSDNLISVGDNAFAFCNSLKTVKLGKQLKHIPSKCFYDDECLEVVDSAAITIGDYAFIRTAISHYDFSNVVSIGDFSFKLARNLEHLYLPSSIKHIGIGCFHRCYNLSIVEIDADVAYLNERLFKAAINLKTAIITNQNIKRLENEVFDDCYALSSISFADKDIEIIKP